MALVTVADFVSRARVLLQDTVNSPYRFSDVDLINSLNDAIWEARRLRPDLFIGVTTIPSYTANDTTVVAVEPMYGMAFVLYMVGFSQLRDIEEVNDTRAAALLKMFEAKLVSVA